MKNTGMLVLVVIELVINVVVFIKLNQVYPFLSLFNQSSSSEKKDTRIVPSYIVTTWGDAPYNVKKAHMELVSRMSIIESTTDSPPLSSQFVSEISGGNQDIPKTIPVKRSTADDEQNEKPHKAKTKSTKHSKSVLRDDSSSKTKQTPDSASNTASKTASNTVSNTASNIASNTASQTASQTAANTASNTASNIASNAASKVVQVSSSNAVQELFFLPTTPITHSDRSLGYGSSPFGAKFTKADRARSNAVMDYALKAAENEPYMITPAPIEKKKELWNAALKSDKFKLKNYKPRQDIVHHAYTIRSNLHIPRYQRMELDLYNALGMPFSYASPDSFPANSYGQRANAILAPTVCNHNPKFMIVVMSHPGHFHERMAIRRSWGRFRSMSKNRIGVLFAMGISKTEVIDHELRYEFLKHSDLIVVNYHDYERESKGHTLALMHALRFVATTCVRTKYIVKTTDDSFLNLKALVNAVLAIGADSTSGFYFGSCVKDNWEYIKDNSHTQYVPPELVKDETERFGWCSGSAWVISADLAPVISLTSMFVPWLSNAEDIEVGKALSLWGIQPYDYNMRRFAAIHTSQNSGALWDYLGYTQMTPADLLDVPI